MSNDVVRILNATITKTVDLEGEIIEKQEIYEVKKSREPNFVKLYVNTLLAFKDLPKTLNPILLEFLSYMSYADIQDKDGGQKIYINSSMKKDIAKKLNMKVNTLDKALGTFVASGVFRRVGTGTYQVNPSMFGKGDWKDISSITATFNFNTGDLIADIQTSSN